MKRKNILLVFGISTLILFISLAVMVSLGWLLPIDQAILLAINMHATPSLDSLFLTVTNLGGALFVTLATLLFLGGGLLKRRYTFAIFTTLVMSAMIISNLVLKSLFERPRPDLWDWLIHETSYSFPSGHATASMALALVLVTFFWKTKWKNFVVIASILYVALVSFSRLYLGVHYPSDILGGWLLSLTIASLIAYMLIQKRRHTKVRDKS